MVVPKRDTSLDALLDLHGQTFVIDEAGHYWVKFEVREIEATTDRPHGLSCSLTPHDASGARIVGFDNAHAISDVKGPGGRAKRSYDHKHRLRTIRPYEYSDAARLLEDFWAEVDSMLRERGVIP